MYVAKFRELEFLIQLYTQQLILLRVNLDGYPIEVNEEMMEGIELTEEEFFLWMAGYEEAF